MLDNGPGRPRGRRRGRWRTLRGYASEHLRWDGDDAEWAGSVTATGRAVDDFVDQAADALRALEEAVTQTLRRLEAERP